MFLDFEQASLAHLDAAYNLAYWLVRNRADAQDVVQDAYLRAFRARHSITGDDIKPWLLKIVRNVAFRWLAVRKRNANVISFDAATGRDGIKSGILQVASEDPSAEDVLLGRAEQDLVRSALTELPPAYREVVVLREFEDLSYQDIAQITGAPIGTVMSRLSRARGLLKTRLADLLAGDRKHAL